ncbi:hypothetical protein HOY82DRAFT_54493 [Tuber indicum]|nr:hypothetical protein HOY82DRAFT_54493 [Tuber indicum]
MTPNDCYDCYDYTKLLIVSVSRYLLPSTSSFSSYLFSRVKSGYPSRAYLPTSVSLCFLFFVLLFLPFLLPCISSPIFLYLICWRVSVCRVHCTYSSAIFSFYILPCAFFYFYFSSHFISFVLYPFVFPRCR